MGENGCEFVRLCLVEKTDKESEKETGNKRRYVAETLRLHLACTGGMMMI